MEAKINRLKQIYACFVDRPVDGVLVVTTNDLSTIFIAHMIDDLNSRSEIDLAFVVTDAAGDPGALADGLVALVQRQREALFTQAELAEGDPPLLASLLAPLPAVCTDAAAAPATRIQALIAEIHARIAAPDRRVTWCLCPVEVRDPAGYGSLVNALLAMPRPPGLRLVLRDLQGASCLDPIHNDPSDESVVIVDFSITLEEAKEASERRATDPSLPPEARSAATLESALNDLGAGRVDDAEDKYRHIVALEAGVAPEIRALAWYGLGELAQARGHLPAARTHLQQALAVIAEAKAPPVQYTVIAALARVSTALGDHAVAESCFACAATLAVAVRSRDACARALEALGDARVHLEKFAEARDAWASAADLWREYGDDAHERAVRRKIEDLGEVVTPGRDGR